MVTISPASKRERRCGRPRPLPCRVDERAAVRRTGVGRGVKAPVIGRGVFGEAGGALREPRHARLRAIVGQRAGNRVARTALRAVDERVAVAPIMRLEKLAQAVLAHGGIGRNGSRDGAVFAFHNGEICCRRPQRLFIRFDALHAREARRVIGEPLNEAVDLDCSTLDLDDYACPIVVHPPRERKLARKAVNERPEANALHRSAHAYPHAGDAASRAGYDEHED